ncbi:MAG: PIG-L family deacetylase, partial [Clostridia bacterium]|nr:PIG-L family deacetylase [Clostridia bacterium]
MKRRLIALALLLGLLALLAHCAGAEASGEAADITRKCGFKVSEGDKDKMFDSSVRTAWSFSHRDAYVGIKIPADTTAGCLLVEWFYDPTGYELIEYDADLNVIQQRDKTASFPNIYTVLPLLPQTKYIQLKLTRTDQKICNLKVYSAGTLPRDVQQWQPPVDKADLMVVSTHQDDELIFLGGTIPYYATALKKPTVVVYMANCNRHRRYEALNALWKMGVTNYPDFINLEDKKVGSMKEAVALWGGKDNILSLLVARIRRYKPEVIVTQDLNGEYGHNQHKVTAQAMMYAIDAAADPEQYPESAEVYGAWQVKKLYHHLYKENEIEMDWETKLDSLNGYSPLQVAQIGMKEHASQTQYYAVKSHGTYDNSKFGLYFTTVGPDAEKDDFLENIDPNASADYVAAHAAEIAAYPIWPELDAEDVSATEADAESETDTAEAEDLSEDRLEAADADESFADATDDADAGDGDGAAAASTAAPEAGEAQPLPTAQP